MDRPSRIIKIPARFAEGFQPPSDGSNKSSTGKALPKTTQGANRLTPYDLKHRSKPYVPSPLSTQLKSEDLHNHTNHLGCLEHPSKLKLCGVKERTYKCKKKVFDDFEKWTDGQNGVKRDKNGRWQATLDPGSWTDAVNEAEGFRNAREAMGIMEEPPRVFLKCLGVYPEEHRPSHTKV